MKINEKLFYFSFPVLMLIFSCSKKDNPVEPPAANQKLFNVSFNVSGFTSDTTPLPSGKSSAVNQTMDQAAVKLSDQVNKLEYLVYNANGYLLKDTIQTSNDANFGTMNMLLPVDNYKLVVVGADGPYSIINKENPSSVAISTYPSFNVGDWFKQVANFKVTSESSSQGIVLDRVVGKVGFVLTDAIPKDIAKISLVFTSGSWISLVNSNDPTTKVQTIDFPLKPSQEGSLNFSSSAFVIPMPAGIITTEVSIRAYNTLGTLVATKTIKNVVVEKNKMTTLSGALFTNLSPQGTANVTVNGDWKPAVVVTF